MLKKVTKQDKNKTIKIVFEDGKAYRYNCLEKVEVGNIVYVAGKRSGEAGKVVEICDKLDTNVYMQNVKSVWVEVDEEKNKPEPATLRDSLKDMSPVQKSSNNMLVKVRFESRIKLTFVSNFKAGVGDIVFVEGKLADQPAEIIEIVDSSPDEEECEHYLSITAAFSINQNFAENGIEYLTFFDGSTVAEIVASQSSLERIVIPSTVRGIRVTSINEKAFANNVNLKEVIFEEGIKTIDGFSGCTSLFKITLPESALAINVDSFANCRSLVRVTLPNQLQYLSGFRNCESLCDIAIPESVTKIGRNAFCGCASLHTINIPVGVKEIGEYAFSECRLLKTIAIPPMVKIISARAFYNCDSLTDIVIPSSVNKVDVSAFNSCKSLSSLVISEGIKTIGSAAFASCPSLAAVTLPQSISEISQAAFCNCSSLRSIVLPEGVKKILKNAFFGCNSLIYIVIPKSVKEIGLKIFDEGDSLKKVYYQGSQIDWKKSIDKHTNNKVLKSAEFEFDTKLTKIETIDDGKFIYDLTDNNDVIIIKCVDEKATSFDLNTYFGDKKVVAIGNSAFNKCSQLVDIVLPNNLKFIPDFCFLECTNLQSIQLPRGLTTLGYNAFKSCESLIRLEFGDNLKTIRAFPDYDSTFENCASLEEIHLGKSKVAISHLSLKGCAKLKKIEYSPDNSLYQSIGGIVYDKSGSTLLRFISHDGGYDFTIPNHVNLIDENAFKYSNISNLIMNNHPSQIEEEAFLCCQNLKSIVLSKKLTSIAKKVFLNCTSLTSVDVPSSVTTIESEAFLNCTSLAAVTLRNNLRSIWHSAFENCTALKDINMPESATAIWGSVFKNCTSLTSVILSPALTHIGEEVFANCIGLTNIIIPSGCESIGRNAFLNCSSLTIIAEREHESKRWNDDWNPDKRPVIFRPNTQSR